MTTPKAFVVGTGKKDVVWKRVQKCLQKLGIDVIGLFATDVAKLCKELFGLKGLLNSNWMEQEAALNSLSTLVSIIPGDIYAQFAKLFIDLPDHVAHDTLSENDIQVPFSPLTIFRTPEGTLSVEQGVYVAESVAPKNLKQAKGRFRAYDKDETLFNNRSYCIIDIDKVRMEWANTVQDYMYV